MKKILVICSLVCLICSSVLADTLYVSVNNGSDSRSRAQVRNRDTPWRTIQNAVNQAWPGDDVVVLNGTYREHIDIRTSGEPGRFIRLRAENQQGPFIVGSIEGIAVHHWVIDGFRLTNRRDDAPRTKGMFFDYSHDITIRNNRVYSCRGGGISLDHSDLLLVEWNITHHNAFYDPDQHSGISVYQPFAVTQSNRFFGITIRNNTSYANENRVNNVLFDRPTDGNGIVVDDTKNITGSSPSNTRYPRRILVENNLCFLNGGQGVHCFESVDVLIRGNTCFQNLRSFDFGGEISVVQSESVDVYNNLLFARSGRYASLQFRAFDVWWNYNLLHNGVSSNEVYNRNQTVYANPLLEPGTLRPLPFSPVVDAGLTLRSLFPFDVEGDSRVQGGRIDMGANELR